MGRNSVIGLDIGTSAVRAAELDLRRDPPTLVRFGQVMLPPGAVRDGEILDELAVGEKLAELWKRAGFKSKRVAVGVSNQRVIVRQVEMPWMEENDLEQGLAFQVQDHLPIPVEDAILDFQILEEFAGPDHERMMRVLLVAAQREMIHTLLSALRRASIRPDVVDLMPFALMRTLGTSPELAQIQVLGDDAPRGVAEAIVDIGAGVTNIVVHEHGVPRFVRILVAGGQEVTDSLATALGTGFEEAEMLKRQAAYEPVGPEAERIIEERTKSVIEEVRGSLDYFCAQPDAAQLGRVVVTGGGGRIPDLVTRLETATGVPTEIGHPLAGVRLGKLGLSPDQLAEAESLIACPVGLALGERR